MWEKFRVTLLTLESGWQKHPFMDLTFVLKIGPKLNQPMTNFMDLQTYNLHVCHMGTLRLGWLRITYI